MSSSMPESTSTSQQDFGGARATVVNRVHRVVRAEALEMQQQRNQRRSLFAPLAIASILLLGICYAAWSWLDINSAIHSAGPVGAPDASAQLLVLMLWSLPVTAALLGFVWLRRIRIRQNGELPQ
jgi:TRAP-type C4-dicarboxylate transport system permease small subunit